MRRLWATAASGAVILLSAGCSSEPAATGSATPAAAPPSAATAPATAGTTPGTTAGATAGAGSADPGDAALSKDTEAICKQASKTSGEAAKAYVANLKVVVQAASSKDEERLQRAEQKAERDIQSWAYALADMSKLAADKDVKKALGDLGKQVATLKSDVKKVDEAQLASVREKLDKACGTA